MPGIPEDKVSVSVILDKKAVVEIDRIAKKIGISRSKMVRNLAYMGLDDAKMLNRIGIYDAIVGVRTLREYIRKGIIKPDEED